jgi:type II secretory pathway pseudopilin PulG
MNNRGSSLIEVMVAMVLLMTTLVALLGAASLATRGGEKSRMKALAEVVASSVVEDVEAHPFGSERPFPDWKDEGNAWVRDISYQAYEAGLPVETKLEAKLSTGKGGTGAFFGRAKDDSDIVHLEVSWSENNKQQSIEVDFEVAR